MALVQLINPETGQVFDVEEAEAAEAARMNRLEPATPEQVADYDARKIAAEANVQTAAEEFGRRGATAIAAFAGAPPVPGMGGPIPGWQPPPTRISGADVAPSLYTPEAALRREVNPIATGVGGAVPSVAAGVLAPGVGLAGYAAGAAIDVGDAALQEVADAEVEKRGISGENILRNGLLNLAISTATLGLVHGVPAGARKVFRNGRTTVQTASEMAAQGAGQRAAAAAAEDLADPSVRAAALEQVQGRLSSTLEAVDSELETLASRAPKVANNPNTQRTALDNLADNFERAQPELVGEIRDLRAATPAERFTELQRIRSTVEDGPLANALDDLLRREELWGKDALDRVAALDAARAARPGADATPVQWSEYADRLRKVGLNRHADDLEGLAERAHQATLAEAAGGPRRSVGAMGAGDETMSVDELEHFLKNDDKIVDQLKEVAGGGEGEKGAFQEFVESFRAVTANRIKREDFRAFAPALDDATRAALHAERDAIVDAVPDVVQQLTARGGTKAASRVTELTTNLSKAETDEIAPILDRLKQELDNVNVKAVRDPNDAFHTVKDTVDPVVERIRGTLENPAYVGDKIAELQQVRNAAWSDKETGFIRNMQIANELGPRLFKKIDVDYNTGDLVMQFDPGAFRALLALDRHEAKPVLEAWAKILDAAERMTANVSEVGAQSASRDALGTLKRSLDEMRTVFETQAKRIEVRDLPSREIVSQVSKAAEELPIVGGLVKTAKKLPGVSRALEAKAAAASAKRVKIPTRTRASALKALKRYTPGTLAGVAGLGALGAAGDANAAELEAATQLQAVAEADRAMTARLLVDPAQAERAARLAGRTPTAAERFRGEHETLQQAFRAQREVIEDFAKDPERLVDLLSEEFGDVADMSPELHRRVVAQAVRIVMHLQEHLPGRRGVCVARPDGTPAGELEIRQYALRFMAATDPRSVMADARAGRLRRESVETLEAVWPEEYQGLRTAVLEQLSAVRSTPAVRQRMNLLFEYGDALDVAMGPKVRAQLEAAREAVGKRKGGPGARGAAMNRSSLPSKAGLTPGGLAALQLGRSIGGS